LSVEEQLIDATTEEGQIALKEMQEALKAEAETKAETEQPASSGEISGDVKAEEKETKELYPDPE